MAKKKAKPKQPKKRATPAPRKKKPRARHARLARALPIAAPLESAEALPLPTAASSVVRIKNCEPSIVSPSDLPPLTMPLPLGPRQFPDDLREAWWPVGDQGRAGACVGWAVGDGLLRWHLVKKNRLPPEERLSVRYFWMAAKELDEYNLWPTTFLEFEGTSIWAALRVAMLYGSLREAELPLAGSLFLGTKDRFLATANGLKVNKVHQLEKDPSVWIDWLRINGPLAVRLSVDAAFERADAANPRLDVYAPYPDSWRHGHAVTLVGYLQSERRFIIRNSWGPAWGDGGWAYATDAYCAAAIDEAWGIYF